MNKKERLVNMLKGIPGLISPDLIKIMMEMGHGDELVLADSNFPAASNAKRLIRYDGIRLAALLDDILKYFPLDYRVNAVVLMKIPAEDMSFKKIQDLYLSMCISCSPNTIKADYEEREAFYNRSSKAYAIVATGETERFANVIIRKGVIPDIKRG